MFRWINRKNPLNLVILLTNAIIIPAFNKMIKDYSVIDLFCGVGGLTHGLVKEGFTVSAGIDFDNSCRYAFETNNNSKFVYKDVTELTTKELNSLYAKGTKKILVGCAPCQPFSIFNHKSEKSLEKRNADTKWRLLYSFAKLIKETQPEIISMENVPRLVTFDEGKVFKHFVSTLEKNGYTVSWNIVNAQDYGIPQRRKRLILFGSKHGKIELIDSFIKDKKYATVRDAIGHLPKVEDGVIPQDDPLHRARKLTDINKRRIQATKEGGFWRDWDKSLWLDCHKKKTGKNFNSVYGRMTWNEVAPTITTYCIGLNNGRFGHPEQDRAITLREAALLQSFPQQYKFIDPDAPFSGQTIARHIGNAVPVTLGVVIAKSIKKHLKSIGKNK